MLRVLIVEDERWEREGLFRLLDWRLLGIDCVDTAIDGMDGYECALRYAPDIIITDIKMPGLNGIEMLKKLSPHLPELKAVILSGYAEFAYAQEALRLGVVEYVLKPVDPIELHTVIAKVVGLCSAASGEQQSMQNRVRKIFLALLDGKEDEGVLCKQWEDLGIEIPQEALLIAYHPSAQGMQHEQYLLEITLPNGIAIALLCPSQAKLLPTGQKIGVADVGKQSILQALPLALDALEHAIFVDAQGLVACDAQSLTHTADLLNHQLLQKLEHATSILDEEEARTIWTAFLRHLLLHKEAGRQAISHLLYDLCNLVCHIVEEEPFAVLGTPLLKMATLDEMLVFCQTQMDRLFANIAKKRFGTEEMAVARTIKIIHEHYMANLSVKSLGAQVYLSPNYLGALFKRHTGQTISDFLCAYRMHRASALLRQRGQKISSVAWQVGIRNTSYFCALFKQTYGMTPGDYQEAQAGTKTERQT